MVLRSDYFGICGTASVFRMLPAIWTRTWEHRVKLQLKLFNILAPGVIKTHATLGGSWQVSDRNRIDLAYIHGFKNTINGSG